MSESIYKRAFPNGLVLVAEPMSWLQSAAFTFSVPAGCVYDPASRLGLASFTCEMALRGAGERDSRQSILDLDNLGVERSESVSDAHTRFSGATLAENLPRRWPSYADLLRRPHLPAEQLEAGRLVMLQELRAVEDEPAQKVMIELRRRHYPEPWGRPSQGEQEAVEAIDARRHPRLLRPLTIGPTARSSAWPAASTGSALKDLVGESAGRLAAAAGRRAGGGPAGQRNTTTCPTIRTRRRSASPTPACPIAIPTISRPGARWACSAAA